MDDLATSDPSPSISAPQDDGSSLEATDALTIQNGELQLGMPDGATVIPPANSFHGN